MTSRPAVVIAVRGGPGAKSRLAGVLDEVARDALTQAMLEAMIDSLGRCRSRPTIWVVTPTPSLAAIASGLGARIVDQDPSGDLNGAFAAAQEAVRAGGPDAALVLLPGDLPLLDPADVDAVFEALKSSEIAIVPARGGAGTGAIGVRGGLTFATAFGPGSFRGHQRAAADRGLSAATLEMHSLAADVDEPADLEALARAAPDSELSPTTTRRLQEILAACT